MKKIWKENARIALIIFISVALASGATYATVTMYASNTVSYDNTTSGLNSTNVQGALDALYVSANNYAAYETRLAALEAKVPDEIYPVGSIYIGVNNTNPGTLFGGTWTSFGTGKTLVGVDTSQTEFDTVEETGGEKTHTLTIAEMPNHDHGNNIPFSGTACSGCGWLLLQRADYTAASQTVSYMRSGNSLSTGGGGAHNNLQPYITVYMWKRTA